jgi:tRNA dimethylallyltransferase
MGVPAAGRTGPERPRVVALVGPTASGKSTIAHALALASTTVELVSVDSMAVYRGMDIGTAKPTLVERARVPVHLVDLVEASDEFTVQQFQAAANDVLSGIGDRGHAALLVGGTGLYLRAVVDHLSFPGRYPAVADGLGAELDAAGRTGEEAELLALTDLHRRLSELDPVAASRIEPSNRRRLVRALEVTLGSGRPFSSFGPGLERYPPTDVSLVGVHADLQVIDRRIAERFDRWMGQGFLDEVRALAAEPGGLSRTARQALGYRELLAHLEGEVSLDQAVETAVQRTRSLARRQLAWFRRDPRIVWVDPEDDPVGAIAARLADLPQPR